MAVAILPCPPELKHYPGAKEGRGMYQQIINQIPPHRVYMELFLGSGTIMRYKRLAPGRTIGIDYTSGIIEAWQKITMPPGIELYNECAIAYLENLAASSADLKDVFIYLDPPYPMASRSYQGKLYANEMSDKDHFRLLEACKALTRSRIAISSYTNRIYQKELTAWRCLPFSSQTRRGKSVELLYMNYELPTELHDYRYLGIGMTDRQRIKRKIDRKVNDWKRLPVLERKALIHALEQKGLL